MMRDDERDDAEGGEEVEESGPSGGDQPSETTSEAPSSETTSEAPSSETSSETPSSDAEAPADESAADAEPTPEPDPLAELQARYDEAQARLRTVSKAYRDLQGEMQAFRERMEARSKVQSEQRAFDQARRFFDPVMNLKRSLAQPTDDVDALRNGLQMVQRQFMDAMEKLGLEELPGEGATFDPQFHEALAVTPVTDEAQDGKVLMVHTAGYAVKGKVLQAAQVVIGKYQADAGEA